MKEKAKVFITGLAWILIASALIGGFGEFINHWVLMVPHE